MALQGRKDEALDDYKFTFEFYLDSSAHIEADDRLKRSQSPDDYDETASLTDSIFEYFNENGRTYHAYHAGSYHFPNDEKEVDRLNNQHEILKILLDNRNYLAPLSASNPPLRILDLATGTGRWAIEMGDEFPRSSVIGTDLSPIQPDLVPPNVRFYVDDANDEWQSGRDWHNIDYIHCRVTIGCWDDMASVIRKGFERLRPGGWMESQEPHCDVHCDDREVPVTHGVKRWWDEMCRASAAAGRPLHITPTIKQMYIDAGFVDVHEKVYKIPMNGWPKVPRLKRLGELWHRNVEEGMSGLSYALFHRVNGMQKEEIEVSLVNVRKDLADQKMHIYEKFYVVWGRKPGDPSDAVSVYSSPRSSHSREVPRNIDTTEDDMMQTG
ncbi:S-adenosyl-L-methionine-dependent methyltransferase [Immersiella caudata]|uniref:S-adenosyl-L-methionine-dependent methyltransferase n=1 Tax=Immersiella caudata TaxID=314043 RepID=A0AA39WWA2_9PEZI|nr:S-adenosyl-L-methionine-dependent methyltransferase [Immersiella caudata]